MLESLFDKATLLKRDSMLLLYSPWGEGKIWNIITLKIAWLWFLMLFIAWCLLLGVPYCGMVIIHCSFLSESRDLQGYDVSICHKFYPLCMQNSYVTRDHHNQVRIMSRSKSSFFLFFHFKIFSVWSQTHRPCCGFLYIDFFM